MPERIVDVSGVAMVVTDLHGLWEPYARLRDAFLAAKSRGEIDTLVLCGDLIHPETSDDPDASLDMLLDVMRLQRELGRESVVMLLGNHEFPHIYSITLAKGDMVYTPAFEAALAALNGKGTSRAEVIEFLAGLPYYARTKAGVLMSHAGAPPKVATADTIQRLMAIDHFAVLAQADAQMEAYGVAQLRQEYERITRAPYDKQAKAMLAVSGEQDPRYHDLLRGAVISNNSPEFELLWNTFFTLNEREDGLQVYQLVVNRFLAAMSELSPHPQRVLVAGHIVAQDGYSEIGTQQLRIASYAHARPRAKGRYLVFDTEKPVAQAAELVGGLRFTAHAK